MGTRICSKCGEEKPETTEYFYRDKSCRAGLTTICKECKRKAVRRWEAENPVKKREAEKRWKAENPEKQRKAVRRWQSENPEKVREFRKRWEANNPEKIRESKKRYVDALTPSYLKDLISAKYDIDRSEIGDELINAKCRELIYYRQLTQLKNQQNETK